MDCILGKNNNAELSAMKVSILKRPHAEGRIGLYLQFSKPIMMPDGKMSRREPLGLFLYAGDKRKLTALQKAHNRETEEVAEIVRARRHIEVQSGALGVQKDSATVMLCDYLRNVTQGKATATVAGWKRMADLVELAGINVPIGKLDVQHCVRFRAFLQERLRSGEWKQSTASHQMAYFRSGIRRAYREGLIRDNLLDRFDPIPLGPPAKKEYLTIEELTKLMKTPSKYPGIRGVVFFAALTGLRTSEIRDLEWSGVRDMPDGSAVMTYYQRKTSKTKTRPMPSQARAIIGQRKDGKVFPHVISQNHLNTQLRRWAEVARIDKHISLHCMRHTFATLQLSAGTPLHVVSDMLDHSSIRMTEVYAKILDEAINEATEKIRIDAPIDAPVPLRLVK
jgi:integrase